MKKIYYLSTFLCLMFLAFSLNMKEVFASETLKLGRQPNIYYTREGGGKPYNSDFYPLYSMNGKVVYCIEPGVGIYFFEYNGTKGITKSPYDSNTNYLIQLIGHYGYEYPGHNTIKYRMATQALLWEKLSGQTVTFYTERYDEGDVIDVSYEKKQIMNLVNNHKTKPNFGKTKIVGNLGETIVLEDKNKVLANFTIVNNSQNEIKKDGNKLYITFKEVGSTNFTLQKAKYDSKATIIYSAAKGVSQKVALLRASDEVKLEMNLEAKAKLKVIKVDDNGEIIKQAGFKFKLKDLKTNEYVCENPECLFETNADGEFETKEALYGDYELEEVDSKMPGYTWNNRKLKITIDNNSSKDGNVIIYKFQNKHVTGEIIIHKKGEQLVFKDNNFFYEEIPLENVEYSLIAADDIYYNSKLVYKKDAVVKKITTDLKGDATITDLYLGKYYLEETKSSNDHLLDSEKHYFELTYEDQYKDIIVKELEFKNYLPKGKLEFLKVDSKTGKSLPEALIEIYQASSDNLVYQGMTDSNGKIILDNLEAGEYYLKEAKSPKGYYLTDEIISFSINEDGEIVSLTMENTPIEEIEVPKTGLSNPWFKRLISLSIAMISLPTIYLFPKKKNY